MHACKFFFTSAYFVCRQNLFKMCTTIVISVIFLFILGVMRLLSIWLLLMAALGCRAVHGLRENDAENKNELRLNYGVYFRAIRKVYVVNDHWAQVFDVRLPRIPSGNLRHTVPECDQLRLRSCNSLRSMFIKMHSLYTDMANEVRSNLQHILDVLPAEHTFGRGHSKRSLLPVGGWLLHGLFGTTTDNDLKPIKKQVTRISQGIAQVTQVLQVENRRLAGFMSLTNHRVDNLVNMTVNQEQAITNLAREFNALFGSSVSIQNAFTLMSAKLMEYTTVMNRLQEFRLGVEMLIQGTVTPVIIDKIKLQQALQFISIHLGRRFPRLYLVSHRVSDIYNAHNFIFGRHGDHLLVQMHIPVTTRRQHLTLYKIETFPVAVDDQLGHVTQIIGLPKYLAATSEFPYYILPTHVRDNDRSFLLNLGRNRDPFRSFRNSPSCASALYKNNRQLIQQLCHFQLRTTSLTPSLTFLSDTELLLLNVTNVTLHCGTYVNQIPPCLMCVHRVNCECRVNLWSNTGK